MHTRGQLRARPILVTAESNAIPCAPAPLSENPCILTFCVFQSSGQHTSLGRAEILLSVSLFTCLLIVVPGMGPRTHI